MIVLLISAIEQALVFFPLSLGIYLSYRILRIPDLTVEGSFITGAALFAIFSHNGLHPITSTLLCTCFSGIAGIAMGIIQQKGKIPPLFSGILALFVLYSVNLLIMGQPNISLLKVNNLFNTLPFSKFQILVINSTILSITTGILLRTKIGLHLKAYGCNKQLLFDLGGYPCLCLCGGLYLGNCFAGLSGALFAQKGGFVDISMAVGVALIGITTVVMGERISKAFTRGQFFDLFALFFSVFLYFFVQHGLIRIGIAPLYLNICLGVFLFLCMCNLNKVDLKGEQYAYN